MDANESHAPPVPREAQSTGLVAFDTAEVISQLIYPPRPVLVVTGNKPYPSMKVELVPLTYIRQPEYWRIEVIGSGTGPHGVRSMPIPYAVELNLAGCTGTVGIEVVGANQTKQIDVASEGATEVVGSVEGGQFRPMYPSWITERTLRLTTAAVKGNGGPDGYEVDLSPYEGSIIRVLGHHEAGWIYSAAIVEQVRDSILSIVTRQVLPGRGHREDS